MHLLLTDVLTCPRCGPRFGLILLAERVVERRVLEGELGCANCRERYGIHGGFADLRPPPARPLAGPAAVAASDGDDAAVRLGALIGLAAGRGFSLIVGDGVRLAPALAGLVDGAEVVAVSAAVREWPEEAGVSRIAAGAMLPFHDRSMRGVALTGEAAGGLLEEGARVLAPVGRLVLVGVAQEVDARLHAAGLRVVARDAETVIAGLRVGAA